MKTRTKACIHTLSGLLLVCLAGASARGYEVDLTGDVVPPAKVGLITPAGGGTTNDPYLYTFTTPGGMNMNSHNISATNGISFRLSMNSGVITNGGSLVTAGTEPGNVGITNGADITLDHIQTMAFSTTSGKFGSVDIHHKGNLTIGDIAVGYWTINDPNKAPGDITLDGNDPGSSGTRGMLLITNTPRSIDARWRGYFSTWPMIQIKGYTNVVLLGSIDASGLYWGNAPHLIIGKDSTDVNDPDRVDSIQVAGINLSEPGTIYSAGTAGQLELYSKGDILIQDGSGTPKDVECWGQKGNTITVKHQGKLTAGKIDTHHMGGTPPPAGDVLFDGNVQGTGPSGAFRAKSINTSSSDSWYGRSGDIAIRGYTGVTIQPDFVTNTAIDSHVPETQNRGYRAGTVSITNISGDILINGKIDLNSGVESAAYGTLDLSCAGKISLSSLDLSKVRTATFCAGGRHTVITNELLNFPVGNAANGKLDAITKQTIHYDPAIPQNSYLTNGYSGIFSLKSGGILTYLPVPKKGTIVFIR